VFVWNGKREMQRGGALAFFLIIVFLLALVYLGFQNYKTEDIVSVEAKDFEKTVIYESKPTVVYFYENERSGPHQYMSPALSLFSKRLKDDVKFCTFYMKEKELCETFDIKYDGTTLLFQDGEEVLREAKFAPCIAWHRGLLFEFLEDYIWEQMVRSPSSSATSEVTFISTGEFEQFVLESNKPVIVNFTISSSGCNKVITMMRSFRYAASRYGGLADFYFVDLDDDNSYLQSEYKINSIPMLVMFHNGEERERFAGCYQDLENKRVIIGMIFPYVAFL
jgi:thioredoxin-like negative regulator of GroEL